MALPVRQVYGGSPYSDAYQPAKTDIIELWQATLAKLTGANAGALIQTSKTALDALAPTANTMAWVIGDADPDLDGVYQYASGTWTKRGPLPYGVIHLNNAGAGTGDAIEVTTAFGLPDAAYGAVYSLNIIEANTGPVTISINGTAAVPVVDNIGQPLDPGVLVPGMGVLALDDGTSLRLFVYGDVQAILNAAEAARDAAEAQADRAESYAAGVEFPVSYEPQALTGVQKQQAQANIGIREVLAASRTYYVRPDGNDANDGLTDTAGGAFREVAAAVEHVWNDVDCRGKSVTIKVADGTYNEPVYKEYQRTGGGRLTIEGNMTTPSNVHLNVVGNGIQTYNGAWIIVQGMKISATDRGLYAAWGGVIWFDKIEFGACGSYHMRASAGYIWLIGSGTYTISGGAPAHWAAHIGGTINVVTVAGTVITLTGTPHFTDAFAKYEAGGSIEAPNATFVGAASGRAFNGQAGGSFNIGSAITGLDALDYLPSGLSSGYPYFGGMSPSGDFDAKSMFSMVKAQAITDDGVFALDLASLFVGIILIKVHTASGAKTAVPVGEFRARTGAPFVENISLDLTGVVLQTGAALTGTTGADGKFTISAHTDGKLYFENRTGATRFITLQFMT